MKKTFKLRLITLCAGLLSVLLLLARVSYKTTAHAQSITVPQGYTVHNINDGGLEITSSGKYYVYGTGEETSNEIRLSNGVQVEMIIDGVNIRGSSSRAYGAIRVEGNSTLTLKLAGSNTLIGCNNAPGIEVSEGNTVIITSYDGDGQTTGYLKARTGSASFINGRGPTGKGGAGIGSGGTYGSTTSPETLGNIIIKGGTIDATGAHGGAGIGGAYLSSTGSIRIEGGIVNARTQEWDGGLGGGAAIGGGFCGYVPKIEITGGTVSARVLSSGEDTMTGADIGSGYFSSTADATINFGDIVISGGNVTADGVSIGDNDSIGFGRVHNVGYNYAYNGSVTVTGGTVIASKRISNLVKVTGGSISGTATGTPTNGRENVSLKTITVAGGFNNQELSKLILSDGSTYSIKDVVILDTNKLYLYLPKNVKVTSATVGGVVYTNYTGENTICFHDARSTYKPVQSGSDTHHDVVYECCGFYSSTEEHIFDNTNANCITPEICACGATKNLYPDIHANTEIYEAVNKNDRTKHDVMHSCCGALIETVLHNFNGLVCEDCGYICEHLKMNDTVCEYCKFEGVAYINRSWNGTNVIEEVKATVTKPTIPNKDTATLTDGWYYLNASYTRIDPLVVSGTVHLIIGNGITVEIRKGIRVEEGNTLYIYAQSNDPTVMGKLIAQGYDQSAAIGSARNVNAGTIVINGGIIQTYTSNANLNGMSISGAAIGGGDSGSGGNITINGGIVSAETYIATVIGNGNRGKNTNVTINGGTITLIGGIDYYGLGGYSGTNSVTINGGTIINSLDNNDGLIGGSAVITGGAFSTINNVGGSVKDANGNALIPYEITLEGLTENVKVEELTGVNYGLFEVQTTADKLWIFLPEGEVPTAIKLANGAEYVCNENGTFHLEHGANLEANCDYGERCERCLMEFGEKNPHEYENGICVHCSHYLAPQTDENGVYQIATAGELFWFANHVNTQNREASALLLADIDLENRPWTPIGFTGEKNNNFRGVFDGQNHTIKGLYVEGDKAGIGFFGEVRTGTVKNFTIYGMVVVDAEYDYVGGVIGSACGLNGTDHGLERNGAIIQNITSYVDVIAGAHGIGMIGGFVGYANHQTLIENCSWYGTFDAGKFRVDNGAGGFIGKIREDSSEVTIRNSAAYGTIKTNYAKNGDGNNATIYIGGFLGFSNTDALTTLENCLFAGKYEKGDNLTDEARFGAFGTLQSVKSINNCYYLSEDGVEAVYSDSPLKPNDENIEITAVTGEQLMSGEVAILLGEAFGQTLTRDNRQNYPVVGGKAVYYVLNCDGNTFTYSNVNEPVAHFDAEGDNNHSCDECGLNGITSCVDSENDGNHECDECGEPLGTCIETEGDGDHLCDECGVETTNCKDSPTDSDHLCDECGEKLSDCNDAIADGNHTCDECGEKLNDCLDSDENYVCDECGAEIPRDGLSGGAIAGIAGGSAAGLGGIGYLVYFLLKRKK